MSSHFLKTTNKLIEFFYNPKNCFNLKSITYMCLSAFYCYDMLYVTISVRKPRIPVNVYCAFKLLLEFEMNSSVIEETLNKSFQTAFFWGGGGGGAYYLI